MAKRDVVKELAVEERSYYRAEEVMMMLGVGKSKAYKVCQNLREEYQAKGLLAKDYPAGRVPKRIFNRFYMIEEGA
jgi:hypothetical protein